MMMMMNALATRDNNNDDDDDDDGDIPSSLLGLVDDLRIHHPSLPI